MLRANAIYLIAALIPVLYAVRIWPAAKTVVRRTTEVLIAVVFVQPVVGLAVAMGAAASAWTGSVTRAFRSSARLSPGRPCCCWPPCRRGRSSPCCRRWRAPSPTVAGRGCGPRRPPPGSRPPGPTWAGWPTPASRAPAGTARAGLVARRPPPAGVCQWPPQPHKAQPRPGRRWPPGRRRWVGRAPGSRPHQRFRTPGATCAGNGRRPAGLHARPAVPAARLAHRVGGRAIWARTEGRVAAVREALRYQFPHPSTSTCWARSPPGRSRSRW